MSTLANDDNDRATVVTMATTMTTTMTTTITTTTTSLEEDKDSDERDQSGEIFSFSATLNRGFDQFLVIVVFPKLNDTLLCIIRNDRARDNNVIRMEDLLLPFHLPFDCALLGVVTRYRAKTIPAHTLLRSLYRK